MAVRPGIGNIQGTPEMIKDNNVYLFKFVFTYKFHILILLMSIKNKNKLPIKQRKIVYSSVILLSFRRWKITMTHTCTMYTYEEVWA